MQVITGTKKSTTERTAVSPVILCPREAAIEGEGCERQRGITSPLFNWQGKWVGIWLVWIQSVSHKVCYRHTGIQNWLLLSWWRCQVSAEHGPPLALTPLSRSVLSRWRWLSPVFTWRDDSPVTNWSQSIYLVTEFQLDCDRGDTRERRAEVRSKDECRNRVRDGGERELMFTHREWILHVTHVPDINFQRTTAKYHELYCSNPVFLKTIVDRATKKVAMEAVPKESLIGLQRMEQMMLILTSRLLRRMLRFVRISSGSKVSEVSMPLCCGWLRICSWHSSNYCRQDVITSHR